MEKKKRGRPSVSDNGSHGAFTVLPIEFYDHVCKNAIAHGESVSTMLRKALLSKHRGGEYQSYRELIAYMLDVCSLVGAIAFDSRVMSENEDPLLSLLSCAYRVNDSQIAEQLDLQRIAFEACLADHLKVN
jgi:hypothetical protein